MPKLSTFKCDQATTGKVLAQSSQSISQLEILLIPHKTSATAEREAALKAIALQNHVLQFQEIFPFGPSQKQYRLRIAAELPGYFHLAEAQKILETTKEWTWGELNSLGQLGILIERAIATTEKLLIKEAE